MKKVSVLITVFLFTLCSLVNISLLQAAETVMGKIASENMAKDIAEKAGGQYVEGISAPATEGNQVALPVMDESTGEIEGYIVADQDQLVAVLNSEGYTDVASALAAAQTTAEAGEAAGLIAESGIAAGTIGKVAAAAAGAAGIAAVASGGDGSSSTTTHH